MRSARRPSSFAPTTPALLPSAALPSSPPHSTWCSSTTSGAFTTNDVTHHNSPQYVPSEPAQPHQGAPGTNQYERALLTFAEIDARRIGAAGLRARRHSGPEQATSGNAVQVRTELLRLHQRRVIDIWRVNDVRQAPTSRPASASSPAAPWCARSLRRSLAAS